MTNFLLVRRTGYVNRFRYDDLIIRAASDLRIGVGNTSTHFLRILSYKLNWRSGRNVWSNISWSASPSRIMQSGCLRGKIISAVVALFRRSFAPPLVWAASSLLNPRLEIRFIFGKTERPW